MESRRGKGAYTRNILTTLIPYKAETGTLRFVPRGVSGIPAVHLKGAGGKRMYITNIQVFAGKEGILFGGSSIPSGTKKPLKTTAGIIIVVETPEMTYTCIPTRKY